MLTKIFNLLLIVFLIVGLSFSTVMFGPQLEPRLMPVVKSAAMTYVLPVTSNELLIVRGYLNLNRDCKLKIVQTYLVNKHDNITDYIKLKNIKLVEQDTGPLLKQWTLLIHVPRMYIDGDNRLEIRNTYHCHRWWDTTETVVDDNIIEVMGSQK